jgi:hypothetical protein
MTNKNLGQEPKARFKMAIKRRPAKKRWNKSIEIDRRQYKVAG